MTSVGAPIGVEPVPCRVLLFTGKGGVGKTSVAAATALRCAESGLRTLVLSTDSAHSLSDAFERELDGRPRLVCDGLMAQELDATERLEETWGEIQGYLRELFGWAGVQSVEAEELCVLPGLEELFALSDIKHQADGGEWDVVVVDCAPTAETIRLLSLPEVLAWYMDRVFPVERRVVEVVRPLLRRLTTMPVAGDDVFAAASRLYDGLSGVRDLLTDARRTTIRLVVNPERMVIAEARRTATYLSLFGYRVDAVVANRLLPEAVTDPWFKSWKETQAEHLAAIEAGFAPLPVLRAELATEELVGLDRLRTFAERAVRRPRPRPASCTRASRCRWKPGATSWSCGWSCRSPVGTTLRWAGATASCWSGWGRIGGRSCCPTRCAGGGWPAPPWWGGGWRSRSATPVASHDDDDGPARWTTGQYHARSAVEHLQLAASEMIAAAHAALDALDEVVSEPPALGVVMTWAARLAQTMAERAWSGAVPTGPAHTGTALRHRCPPGTRR